MSKLKLRSLNRSFGVIRSLFKLGALGALTQEFGRGFSERYLRTFRQFYLTMPNYEIWKSRFPNLTWTHIQRSLRAGDETAVRWYIETVAREMWSEISVISSFKN